MSIRSTLLSTRTATTATVSTADVTGSGTPVRLVSRSTEWMADGECRNHAPETFFPSDGVGVDRARKICATCKVQNHCLEYALAEEIEHGVWGGASERERRRIKKRRRTEAGL